MTKKTKGPGWHGEKKRHSLAARGIRTKTEKPLLRFDLEDSIENRRGTGTYPVWIILSDAYSKNDPLFEKMLNFYGWEHQESETHVIFHNQLDDKTITIDQNNTVTFEDYPRTETQDFSSFEDAFIFVTQQLSFDMKEKDRTYQTR